MKRYSVISLGLLLSLVLLPSCREKTRSGRPTVAVVESILSGEISEESLILKKLGVKDYSLGPNELIVLHRYKVFTYGDFIAKSEEEISSMKTKNGINLGKRLLIVHKNLRVDYKKKHNRDWNDRSTVL